MGVVFHHYISPYSFVMGVLWFNAFVLLGLLMRKLKFPIKFSVLPLLLLLVLSIFRMFIAIERPNAVIILSETIYPTLVDLFRFEIVPFRIFSFHINLANILIFIWILVTLWLITRYLCDYISKFGPVMKLFEHYKRDEYAESLLADAIGKDKRFKVYRSDAFKMPSATAVRPYIILPMADFSDDELRVVLLHEWKHIQDKDYLTGVIVEIICFVFWWNPVARILRKNFHFALELKSDQFAIDSEEDFHYFMDGLLVLDKLAKEKADAYMEQHYGFNTLVRSCIQKRLSRVAICEI